MSKGDSGWKDDLSEREQDIAIIMGSRMNDAAFTKRVMFDMSEKYGQWDLGLNIVAAASAGFALITTALNVVPVIVLVITSANAALFSFISTLTDYDRRALEAERAGEAYNTMFNRYRAFYSIVLKADESEINLDEKKNHLNRLMDRHEELNKNTISTDSDIAMETSDEDVLSQIETTDEELERLLNQNTDGNK